MGTASAPYPHQSGDTFPPGKQCPSLPIGALRLGRCHRRSPGWHCKCLLSKQSLHLPFAKAANLSPDVWPAAEGSWGACPPCPLLLNKQFSSALHGDGSVGQAGKRAGECQCPGSQGAPRGDRALPTPGSAPDPIWRPHCDTPGLFHSSWLFGSWCQCCAVGPWIWCWCAVGELGAAAVCPHVKTLPALYPLGFCS